MVYLVLNSKTNLIKIGTSEDARKRVRDLENAGGCELEILLLLEGGMERERELHEQFKKWRTQGEWFHYTHEIAKFIEDTAIPMHGESMVLPLPALETLAWQSERRDEPAIGARQNVSLHKQTSRRIYNLERRCGMHPDAVLEWALELLEAHLDRDKTAAAHRLKKRTVEVMGQKMTLEVAARKYPRHSVTAIARRLDEGMNPEDALDLPPGIQRYWSGLRRLANAKIK